MLSSAVEERLGALERTIQEIDALSAIYGGINGEGSDEEGDGNEGFRVLSAPELRSAQRAVEEGSAASLGEDWSPPLLDVELWIRLDGGESMKGGRCRPRTARMRCVLPPGYPDHAVAVPAVTSSHAEDGMRRSERDALTARLCQKAGELGGGEALMELALDLRESVEEAATVIATADEEAEMGNSVVMSQRVAPSSNGRRWIWVHHITNSGRQRDILREARGLSLGGYLKSGYPGIVVVEGDAGACDEFVTWIKGNKSRPGGFGRNWGHHVRGEINLDERMRRLPEEFKDLKDDMGALGELCKEHGLEAEFLKYVMQHNVVNSINGIGN